jgi:hypothetical protein
VGRDDSGGVVREDTDGDKELAIQVSTNDRISDGMSDKI